jgi:hypothetical protein
MLTSFTPLPAVLTSCGTSTIPHHNSELAHEPLSIRRVEARYTVPMYNLTFTIKTLQSFMSEEPFSGQTIDTIYYATQNFRMPLGSFIRVRTYSMECRGSETFFELKKTQGGEITKERVPMLSYQDGQMITLTDFKPLEGTFDPELIEELFACLRYDSNSLLYPYLKVTSKRLYFTSDSIRATIDTNLQYTGYFGTMRSEPHLIGEDEFARLELKAHSPATIDNVIQTLTYSGVDLSAVQEGRKDQLQRLYFTMKDRLKEQDNVIDEAPNYEIEAKLLVDETLEHPWSMVDRVAEETTLEQIPNFSYPDGMTVRDIDSHIILFGKYNGQRLEEALVVVTDELANLYAIKRKLNVHTASESGALFRPEEKKILVGKFDDVNRLRHLKEIENAIGTKLIEVGSFEKRKRFTTLMHKSGRLYDISVDQSRNKEVRLSQWEIEYKGRMISDDRENTDVFQCISHEIGEISSYIQQRFPGEVRPTTLTKFEWFIKIDSNCLVTSQSR